MSKPKKQSDIFFENDWPIVKVYLIDDFLSLQKALAVVNTTVSDFYSYISENKKLAEDYVEVRKILKEQIAFHMVAALNEVKTTDPWMEKKIKLKIDALSKIYEILEKEENEQKDEQPKPQEISIKYVD